MEGMGADVGGESVDSIDSLPHPEHRVTGKGKHDRPQSGNETDTDSGRVDSTGAAPYSDNPGFVSLSESQHSRREGGTTIEGRETSKRGLDLSLDVKHAMESGPGRRGNGVGREKVNRVDSPQSAPSMGSKSTQTLQSHSLSLTIPQATLSTLLFLILPNGSSVPMKICQVLQMRIRQAGSLLRTPQPNYSSAG